MQGIAIVLIVTGALCAVIGFAAGYQLGRTYEERQLEKFAKGIERTRAGIKELERRMREPAP